MWKETFLLGLFLLAIAPYSWTQPPGTVSAKLKAEKAAEKSSYDEAYESRIKKSTLYGVYIPRDLGDAFRQINELTDKASREKFAGMSEADARYKLHFSLGRWIINNWGFYQGSRLSKYLNDIGIYEPDDMARFIIITYHRELNDKPLGVKALVEDFQEKRRLEMEQRLQEGEVIHEEIRKRPIKEND